MYATATPTDNRVIALPRPRLRGVARWASQAAATLPELAAIARGLDTMRAPDDALIIVSLATVHVKRIAALPDDCPPARIRVHVDRCEDLSWRTGKLFPYVPGPIRDLLERSAGILEGLEILPKGCLPRGHRLSDGAYTAELSRLPSPCDLPPIQPVVDGRCPVLLAYVKPSGTLAAWCAHCGKWHHHGIGEGHRVSHCFTVDSPYSRTGYNLVVCGQFTEAVRKAHGRERRPPRCKGCHAPISRALGSTHCPGCRPHLGSSTVGRRIRHLSPNTAGTPA